VNSVLPLGTYKRLWRDIKEITFYEANFQFMQRPLPKSVIQNLNLEITGNMPSPHGVSRPTQ
jgi:hypothetical protein